MSVVAEGLLRPHWPSHGHRVHVMVSGGADSMALMAFVSEFHKTVPRDIVVHHCHHGVAADADGWAQFVRDEASKRGFETVIHDLQLTDGVDFEARARQARYAAVEAVVLPGDVVMTAHHRDDQIETLLLRLAQGSGLIGLAGIPVVRALGSAVLVRPLLQLSRQQLRGMLALRNIPFVSDPSNAHWRYRRNFIRLKLLPALSRVAPDARMNLLKLSQHATDRVLAAGEALGEDCPTAHCQQVALAGTELLVSWQVRFFAQAHGLFAPSTDQIDEFSRQCLNADDDRVPELLFAGSTYCIRRWGGSLYWIDSRTLPSHELDEQAEQVKMPPNTETVLEFPNGQLRLQSGSASEDLQVYFAVHGRSFRLGRRRPLQSLKQLAQTLRIPPWLRKSMPLLARGDQLLGWGTWDAREQSLIPHSLRWQWEMVPRQTFESSVS